MNVKDFSHKGEKMFQEDKHKNFYKFIKFPSFKPSDYFLFKSIRDYFFPYHKDLSNTRQVFVLSMRFLYSKWNDPSCREEILSLAEIIQHEDLDRQLESVIYKSLEDILKESEVK